MKIKKPIALALTVVIATLSLAACGGVPKNSGVSEERIPNPFVEYQTLEATEQQAAFTITLPPPHRTQQQPCVPVRPGTRTDGS